MKMLVILPRIPYPLEKGDKLRAFHFIKEFSKTNEIHLVALNDGGNVEDYYSELKPYCKSIHVYKLNKLMIVFNMIRAFVKGLPFQVGYFYNKSVHQKIDNLIDEIKPDHIFIQLLRVAEYIQNKSDIPVTIDYMDAFAKGIERRYKKARFPFKYIFRLEYERLRRYEFRIFHFFKHHLIISEQDLESLNVPDRRNVTIVRNGVDTSFFHPMKREIKYDVIFSGNMSYPPNVEASKYLCKQVLPLLLEKNPDFKILIAGINPTAEVRAMASKNIIISGWVDDMREVLAESKVHVAPMLIGTGLQNKLLQAMAMKIPCVTTPLANNALGAEHDKEIVVANSPEEFAEAINKLITNEDFYQLVAEKGYEYVIENFVWKSVVTELNKMMLEM